MRVNRSQSELAIYEPAPIPGFPGAETPGGERQESLLQLIDDRLRGRWKWMILLALVLGMGFGVLGYLSAHPTFLSGGSIRITPRLPVILGETPEHRLDFFSNFVATQVHLMRGRRVLEHAMEDSELAALPWAKQGNALGRIEERLIVESDRQSELITVSFEHDDPKVSQAVVNAVLGAYFDIYGKAGGDEIGRTLETLYEHRDQLERDMRAVRSDLARIRARHEAADLRELQSMKLAKIQELEARMSAAERALTRREAEAGDDADGGAASVTGPTPQQLELIHPKLADLRQMHDNAETEFKLVQSKYRPGTPRYDQARQRLEAIRRLFDAEHAKALELWDLHGREALPLDGNAQDMEGFYQGLPADMVREEMAELQEQVDTLREDLQTLIVDLQALDDAQYEKDRIQAELNHTVTRIQQLELNEESIVKRISIAQEGFLPHSPHADSRKKRAVLGFGFGCMVSFGCFFLVGTIDRRAYGARQLRQGMGESISGCLGVLPDLGASLRDPESSDVAAHCVHQIRNQIEAMRDPHQGYVLAVSSPYQGDGKTSIVMALGWSYAAAGYKTLLIDCDLVGRSLTRQLGLLGREGLREVIRGHDLNGHAASLPAAQLHALAAGVDLRVGPESLRRTDLERLFDEARKHFEVTIVDTGPMLGSLESTPVTSSADGVVLSVRRGRSRTRLEECRTRLRNIGANCIGVILNYAVRSDCNRYVSEASLTAAEHHGPHGEDDRHSVIRTAEGERNVLMLAMEHTARSNEDEEQAEGPSS